MDIGSSIAAVSMDMKLSQAQMDVSTTMAKKVMDQQEVASQEVFRMMPDLPQIPPKGDFIDVYA